MKSLDSIRVTRALSVVMAVVLLTFTLASCKSTTTTSTVTTTVPTTVTSAVPTTVTTTVPPGATTTPTPAAGTPPPEVTQYAKDWPLPQHDYANTRATKDSTINSSNVNTLGVAWSLPIPGAGGFGSAATNPIVMGNTVYFQDLALNTFAIDKNTGKVNWTKTNNSPNIGPTGASVGYGKVFIPKDPFSMAALDAVTGKVVWTQEISNINTIGIDFQPIAYDGMVLVSSVPGSSVNNFYQGGAYGTFFALDQATGKVLWKWDTVDDTKGMWGNPSVNSGGGAWFPPAVDVKTGMTYWGVANPGPLAGTKDFPNGTSHPGPNLYTNSLVAIDHATGKLQWFNQVWPHDINDYDLQQSPILATATINGKQQDIVIGAGKMGTVYAFNRQTGALLWQANVGKHQNDLLIDHNLAQGQTSLEVYPGIFGGVETPMAYADGVVYVPSENLSTSYTPNGIAGLQPFSSGTGNLTAIDVNFGRVLWDVALPANNFGGATVVNDLVFTATYDGTIYAFKRDTGQQVWTYKAPAGIKAWPAVSGDMIIWPCGAGGAPSLVALKLGATAPLAEIARPVDGGYLPAGDITVSAAALNFKLVDKLGQSNVPGEGHLHYFLDVDAPTAPGQPAVTAPGTYAATVASSYTWKNVPAGSHTLSIELVNNDHTPLNPPVVQKVTVTVLANVPSVQITSPKNRDVVSPGPVTITVSIGNFTLTTGAGLPNASNQGKIIYYMDSAVPSIPGEVTTTKTSVTSSAISYTFTIGGGTHAFSVQLVNNDLTPLPIPAIASVVVQNMVPPNYTGQ